MKDRENIIFKQRRFLVLNFESIEVKLIMFKIVYREVITVWKCTQTGAPEYNTNEWWGHVIATFVWNTAGILQYKYVLLSTYDLIRSFAVVIIFPT